MASKLLADPRIDPRIKAIFGAMPETQPLGDVANREELLAIEASESGRAMAAAQKAMIDMRQRGRRALGWPGHPHRALRLVAGRQLDQHPVHPPR